MSENTEARDIIDVAQEAVGAQHLEYGIYYDGVTGQVVDIREQIHQEAERRPDRKTGHYYVADVPSFAAYLAKHALPQTEMWGRRDAGTIEAIINAHLGTTEYGIEDYAGHEDHDVTLRLRHSDDWKEWTGKDGQLLLQVEFAEFIEDHRPNFGKPTAAEMLELAQTFRSTNKVEFNSSHRVKSGETSLAYAEVHDAKAGKKGELTIPDEISIAMPVYDQGKPYLLTARLRYRINNGQLLLGFKLNRPKDTLQTAFDDVVTAVQDETGRDVWATS